MLKKDSYLKLLEASQYTNSDRVYVHYPLTEDVVWCHVKGQTKDKLLLSFDESSDYYGAPDFWFKKLNVIGKVK